MGKRRKVIKILNGLALYKTNTSVKYSQPLNYK